MELHSDIGPTTIGDSKGKIHLLIAALWRLNLPIMTIVPQPHPSSSSLEPLLTDL